MRRGRGIGATTTLIAVGALCSAIFVAAVATMLLGPARGVLVSLAWLLVFAAVCFAICVARLPRGRTGGR